MSANRVGEERQASGELSWSARQERVWSACALRSEFQVEATPRASSDDREGLQHQITSRGMQRPDDRSHEPRERLLGLHETRTFAVSSSTGASSRHGASHVTERPHVW